MREYSYIHLNFEIADMILPNFTNPLTYVSVAWNILIMEFFSEHQKDGPEVQVFNNIQ